MNKIYAILKYAGVLCIPVYIVLVFISHLIDTKITPFKNWLSDYGNPMMNPSGALVYNTGCVIIAALLIIFYIGIFQWYKKNKIKRKFIISYVCAQISGIFAAIFLVMACIFPLGTHTGLHSTFSTINMIGMDCFLSFTAIAFFMNPSIKNWIGILAFLTSFFNIVTMNMFSSFYISEWIYFLLFMLYQLLIILNYDKILQPEARNI